MARVKVGAFREPELTVAEGGLIPNCEGKAKAIRGLF